MVLTMSLSAADIQRWSPRLKPRWGEYDVISHDGRDCRLADGLSRFRTNFDCCHQAFVPGSQDPKIDTFGYHMLPRPFDEDVSGMVKPHKIDRHVARPPHVDVFPQHDPTRKDNSGEYILPYSTRSAIENVHRKLYCAPRYSLMYPDRNEILEEESEQESTNDYPLVDFASPETFPLFSNRFYNTLPNCPNSFDDYGTTPDIGTDTGYAYGPSNYEPSFFTQKSHLPQHEKTLKNANQNFHDMLVPDVYRYRLPSILHYPDECIVDQVVPEVECDEEEVENIVDQSADNCTKFFRPIIPPSLLKDMSDLKMEMKLAKQNDVLAEQKPFRQRPLPSIDSWTNWPQPPKLSLPQKSETQKRFNIVHPETIPDLREFNKYSKKVFFNGYNSSAFRG